MKQDRNHESVALGICRHLTQHEVHELNLVIRGKDGEWTKTLNLNLRPAAPAQFWIYELSAAVKKSTEQMKQLSSTHSEFSVGLQGASSPVKVTDLSGQPTSEWMISMFKIFARCQAAIAILVSHGRVSVTLHQGDL